LGFVPLSLEWLCCPSRALVISEFATLFENLVVLGVRAVAFAKPDKGAIRKVLTINWAVIE
jgi:hypothetical protein